MVKKKGRKEKGVPVSVEKRRDFIVNPKNTAGRIEYPFSWVCLFIQIRI